MSYMKQNFGKIVAFLLEILLGVLLLLDPGKFTAAIIIVIGVVSACKGLFCIIRYFRLDPEQAAAENTLSKGLVALLLGLFCAFQSEWFINTFPVITTLYGVVVLLSGLNKLQGAVDILRMKVGCWQISAVSAAVTIALAIIVLWNPFASAAVLWRFLAVVLIADAVLDAAALIIGGRNSERD